MGDILSSQGRVFIAEPRMYGDAYEYHGCMKAESMSKQGRTLTQVYDGNKIVAQLSTRGGQWTETLTGNLAYGQESALKRAFETGCILMIQIHWGTAGNPADFSGYEAGIIFENAVVTDYSTTALTATQSSETEQVKETVTITFESAKWISSAEVSLRVNPSAGAIVAMALAPSVTCDSCDECGRLYMLVAEQVSESVQSFRLMWSDDNGANFSTAVLSPVSTLDIATVDFITLACSDRHVFIGVATRLMAVTHASLLPSVPFRPLTVSGTDPLYSIIRLTGDDDGIYVMTNSATVYFVNDALVVETLINQGSGVSNPVSGRKTFLFSAYFTPNNHISRIWTDVPYRTLPTIVGTTPITALVEDLDKRIWAATEDGKLFCGGIDGYDWRLITTFAPSCASAIVWHTHSIGYLAAGRYIYRTVNGGYDWQPLPSLPTTQTQIIALALCADGTLFAGGAANAGTTCFSLDLVPEEAVPLFAVAG